jgi:hypothetical protein
VPEDRTFWRRPARISLYLRKSPRFGQAVCLHLGRHIPVTSYNGISGNDCRTGLVAPQYDMGELMRHCEIDFPAFIDLLISHT